MMLTSAMFVLASCFGYITESICMEQANNINKQPVVRKIKRLPSYQCIVRERQCIKDEKYVETITVHNQSDVSIIARVFGSMTEGSSANASMRKSHRLELGPITILPKTVGYLQHCAGYINACKTPDEVIVFYRPDDFHRLAIATQTYGQPVLHKYGDPRTKTLFPTPFDTLISHPSHMIVVTSKPGADDLPHFSITRQPK
jgi:hypothetical protein